MIGAARARAPFPNKAKAPPPPDLTGQIVSHKEMMWANAGYMQEAINFVEGRLAEAEMTHQTRVIARKLEAGGWNPYRSNAGEVVTIGLVSGAIIRDGGWRNSNLLPAVAKRNRAGFLSSFMLWLYETSGAARYCRYCVISSGVRCTLEELPERLKLFNRKLGDFIEWSREEPFDVRVQLIAIEATFNRNDEGDVTVNLHANIVYWPQKVLNDGKKDDWTLFLDTMRGHFGVQQIEDCGIIEKPQELIKYACKPAEVMQLTSKELAFLAETLHRKQLVRPVGEFAAFRKELKEQKAKVSWKRDEETYVRSATRTKEEIERAEIEQELREFDRLDPAPEQDGDESEAKVPVVIENQILFQTLPQARTAALTESFVGVRNYTLTPTTEVGRHNLGILEERRVQFLRILHGKDVTADQIARAASRLDTCTITPPTAAAAFPGLPETRRKRILRQLAVPEARIPRFMNGGAESELVELIREKLDRVLPRERHEWAVPVDELFKQFDGEAYRAEEAEIEAECRFDKAQAFADFLSKNLTGVGMIRVVPEELDETDVPAAPVVAGSIRERAIKAAEERRKAQIAAGRAV